MINLKKLSAKAEEKFQSQCRDGEVNFDINKFEANPIEAEIFIDENKQFKNKFELAKYLGEKLKGIEPVSNNLWHFLTIVYHKQLLKNNKIGQIDRFYIDGEKTHYPFTHLLKPTFDLYSFYSKDFLIN